MDEWMDGWMDEVIVYTNKIEEVNLVLVNLVVNLSDVPCFCIHINSMDGWMNISRIDG